MAEKGLGWLLGWCGTHNVRLAEHMASARRSGGEYDAVPDSSVEESAKRDGRWRLLLQLDTDGNPGWMWGDMGRLYFWITDEDLREGVFEKCWMILQCA